MLPLAGCIAHAPGSGGGSQTPTLTITPDSGSNNPTIPAGTQVIFTSTSNAGSPSVSWFLDPSGEDLTCAPAYTDIGFLTCGPEANQVTYTAPPTAPSPNSITLVAVIASDNSVTSNTETITIGPNPITISLATTPSSVTVGTVVPLTATLNNTTYQQVGWEVNGIPDGNGDVGFITQTVLYSTAATYTAPATVPSTGATVTITAAAVGNPTGAIASAPITITTSGGGGGTSGVGVSVTPTSATVPAGGTASFTASVTGTTNQGITWSVVPPSGYGTVAPNSQNPLIATYTAPTNVPTAGGTATLVAQSQADTSIQATAAITLTAAAPVTVTPSSTPVAVGENFSFAASETGVTSFTWTVAPGPTSSCGNLNLGSISSNGLYTAPPNSANLTASPCEVLITATDPSGNSGSAVAAVHVTVSINTSNASSIPNPTEIGLGANWLYAATVNGSSNQQVNWTSFAPGGTCPGSFPASVSPYTFSGFYYAPLCLPTGAETIQAGSVLDSTQTATTTVSVGQNDPIGTATVTSTGTTCPTGIGGAANASCYTLDVSCPGAADWPDTYLKVNQPTGTSQGTVILISGSTSATSTGGGSYTYDVDPSYLESDGTTNGGYEVVEGLLADGFTTVQVAFSPLNNPTQASTQFGWLTGPGGVRRLACRFATVASWVATNSTLHASTKPLCATGNSGGSGAIAYALTLYGQTDLFTMVESTSGPPMSHLDTGCTSAATSNIFTCNGATSTLPFNFSLEEAGIIDPAYGINSSNVPTQPFCSNAVSGTGTQAPADMFLSDSVLGGMQPVIVDPPTITNLVFGGLDTTAAVKQGQDWGMEAMETPAFSCVTDAPHALASVPDGVTQIVNDIQTSCKLN